MVPLLSFASTMTVASEMSAIVLFLMTKFFLVTGEPSGNWLITMCSFISFSWSALFSGG
jgi:hypothetical protein